MGKVGRPKGKKKKRASGRPLGAYSDLSVEEKSLYHRTKARESKGYKPLSPHKTPPRRLSRELGNFNRVETQFNYTPVNPGRGRPPLDKNKGAMDKETIKDRKRKLGKDKYQKDKISEIRRNAAKNRRDRLNAEILGSAQCQESSSSGAAAVQVQDADLVTAGGDTDTSDNIFNEDTAEPGGPGNTLSGDLAAEPGGPGNTLYGGLVAEPGEPGNTLYGGLAVQEDFVIDEMADTAPGNFEDPPSDYDKENRPHPKTVQRRETDFFELLPENFANQLDLLKNLVKEFQVNAILIDKTATESGPDRTTIWRQKPQVIAFLISCHKKYGLDPSTFLLGWAQKLISQDEENFCKSGLSFANQKDVPKQLRIQKISDKHCAALIKERRDPDCRRVSIKHAVKVAQEGDLHCQKGDIATLVKSIGSSRAFASKVLKAVDTNQIENLLKRKSRTNSVQAGGISDRLRDFLANPEHSRALPGHETISVAYRCRKPKFLLKKSKIELLGIFRKENTDISFSYRVLLREWPLNFVPPTPKDELRNVCPIHSNLRRCLEGLQKVGAATNLPKSVRALCATNLCPSPTSVPLVPSTWPHKCALGTCTSCPKLVVDLPDNTNTMVHFLQWQKGESSKLDQNGKPKQVVSLFPALLTLDQAVKKLLSFFPKMKTHVFVATIQYEALKQRTDSLQLGDLLTIEDYTMNIDIVYSESTTSSHYSANTVSYAGYPVAVRYRDPITLKPAKGAILFVSVDKKHDFEQVEVFERRSLEICEQNCGQFFENWNRWSDNCSGQFKSRKTLGKLVQASANVLGKEDPDQCNISWEFLEANEAKNESDTIGGFSKTALRHTILRDPNIVIHTPEDLVTVIKKGLEKSCIKSEKYSFIHIEAVPPFEREKVSVEIPVPGIQSLHSFKVLKGGILGSQLSCLQCSVGKVCDSCKLLELTVSADEVKIALLQQREGSNSDESEDESEAEIEDDESDSEDDLGSDIGDEETDMEESEEEASLSDPGSIVWVLWGRRWYPARVVLLVDVPEFLRNSLRKDDGKSVLVRFYEENTYSRVDVKKIEELGQSNLDLKRCKFQGILEKYQLALADLKYKV